MRVLGSWSNWQSKSQGFMFQVDTIGVSHKTRSRGRKNANFVSHAGGPPVASIGGGRMGESPPPFGIQIQKFQSICERRELLLMYRFVNSALTHSILIFEKKIMLMKKVLYLCLKSIYEVNRPDPARPWRSLTLYVLETTEYRKFIFTLYVDTFHKIVVSTFE